VLLALSARLEAQVAQLAALTERVEELEQRLKRDYITRRCRRATTRRGWGSVAGRGGRGGRRAASRAILVTAGHCFLIDRVTEVVNHWPERCCCRHVFSEEGREPARAPARHQVAELPTLAVGISEHRLQRLCCPDCGSRPLPVSPCSPRTPDV
jgi:hypothetical protein